MNTSVWRKYRVWSVAGVAAWWLVYRSLAPIAAWFTYSLLGMAHGSHLAAAVEFFVYEAPKVLMLLVLVVFGVGIVRSFFTPERTRRILSGKREFTGNVLAALLGIVTPFCSCSAVPLFIGFVTTGVPLGVTLSFLISAPMVNEIALVLLFGLFGWKVAAIYLVTGVVIAIVAGWMIGKLRLEKHVEDWVYQTPTGSSAADAELDWPARIRLGLDAVKDIVGRVWIYVLIGIGIGRAFTVMCRRISWPPSWAGPGGRFRWPCSSACRCTQMPPELFPSCRHCSAKEPRWERCWRL